MGVGVFLEPLLPRWVVLFAAVAIGSTLYLYYARWHVGLSDRRRAVLAGLRAAGVVVLLGALLGPGHRSERTVRNRSELAVLIDVSESMAEADAKADAGAGKPAVRLDAVRKKLMAAAGRLCVDFDLALYAFDEGVRFLGRALSPDELREALDGLEPAGKATALGDSLLAAAPAGGGAILVLSDGASNRGLSPSLAAKRLAARGVRVFAVGFGRTGGPNVAVKRVLGPRVLIAGEPAVLHAEIVFSPGVTGPVMVVLERDSRQIAVAEADPSAGTGLVALPFTPRETGEVTYVVRAEALPSETKTSDNSLEHTVRVTDERLRVLYVEQSPRWEYRFLKNAIVRDGRLDVALLLLEADSATAEGEHSITSFPATRAELFKFDVVVVGDVPAEAFSRQDKANLRAFVSEGGGGVLLVAGPRHNPASYAGGPLGDLSPATSRGRAITPAGGASLVLTETGAANAALTLSAGDPRALWRGLPGVFWVLEVEPGPGARVLVETRGEAAPVIIEQRFGRGRTILVATDELWRWRRYVGDRYLYRLWVQLVRFLGSKRFGAAGELALSKPTYSVGETVEATAYLEDGDGAPLAEGFVEGYLESEGGSRVGVIFSRSGGAGGVYRASFPAAGPGSYSVRVATAGAGGYLARGFVVSDTPSEAGSPAADAATLERLAAATGGRFFREGEGGGWGGLGALGDLLPAGLGASRRIVTERPWASWWFLAPMAGAFVMEWILRKRWGLA